MNDRWRPELAQKLFFEKEKANTDPIKYTARERSHRQKRVKEYYYSSASFV